MGSMSKLLRPGSASQLFNNSGAVLALWIVAGLFAAFALYLFIDALVERTRRRNAAAGRSETDEMEEPGLNAPSERKWAGYLEATCHHCETALHVPKARRFKPFLCPACNQMNPPLKKEILAPTRRFLRWLFYP